MDNARYGNINATDEQVINACKIAGLDKDIQTFENGMPIIKHYFCFY